MLMKGMENCLCLRFVHFLYVISMIDGPLLRINRMRRLGVLRRLHGGLRLFVVDKGITPLSRIWAL